MSQLSHRPSSSGTGGNIAYSIDTFSEGEIEVYVDGVKKTNGGSNLHDYTIPDYTATGGTITWNTSGSNTAPDSSFKIHIIRRTQVLNNGGTAVEGKATFEAGSAVKATDLNNNTKQVLRAIQERHDQPIARFDLEDGEVVRSKIAADAVDGTKIADDSVDSEHIVADSLDTEHYAPQSVDTAALADDAVTTQKILNNAVTVEKLAGGALPTDITVTTDNIVNGTIVNADVSTSAAIAGTKIAPDFGSQVITTTNNIVVGGTVDGRDVAADGSKLDTIESGATGDQSNSEIRAAVEAASDSNVFTDADHSKLNGIEAAATQDQTAAEIKVLLQSNKLTNAEIDTGTLDGRYYTETEADALFLRQDSSETIASGVTWSSVDDKVATTAAIDARIIDLVDDVGGFVPIANETSFPTSNPDINTSNANKGGTIVSVQATSTQLTPSSGTVTIANGRGTGNAVILTGVPENIPSGFGFLCETTATDHTYAFHRLTAKATEVSTTAQNITQIVACGNNLLDIENFADLYQVSASAPTTRADSSNLTIGDLWFDSSSNQVLMVYDGSSGDGFSPVTPNQSDLTNINIVAGHVTFAEDLGLITNAVNTGSGNNSVNTVGSNIANVNTAATNIAKITTVADDLNEGTSEIDTVATNIANVNTVGNAIANVNTTAGSIANVNTTAGSITNVNTTATNISNINTVAASISDVNTFANRYRIASSAPTTSLDEGDLYFDTTQNELRIYNGAAWQGGVTATGNLVLKSGSQMTGNLTFSGSQTVDGRDVSVDGAKLDGIETGATADQTASEIVTLIAGQTIAPNVITTTNLTLDFGSIA